MIVKYTKTYYIGKRLMLILHGSTSTSNPDKYEYPVVNVIVIVKWSKTKTIKC